MKIFTQSIYVILLVFALQLPALSNVNLGMKVLNNQWQQKWVLSSAPEIFISFKNFGLLIDGTMGTYELPNQNARTNILQIQGSVIPMYTLTFRSLYVSAGYGFTKIYQRVETAIQNGQYRILSQDHDLGEFRIKSGIFYPLNRDLYVYIEGGYAYSNEDYRSVFLGSGIVFSVFKRIVPKKTVKPQDKENKNQSAISQYQNFVVINTDKSIDRELITSIESALLSSKRKVTSWESMKSAYYDHKAQSILTDLSEQRIENDPVRMALIGAKTLPVDAIIDTQMRYTYKSYGGKIIVNSVLIRILDAKTGLVKLALEPDVENMDYNQAKEKVTALIKTILK